MPCVGYAGIELYDAEALLLMNKNQEALIRMDTAISRNWSHAWWQVANNPAYEHIREQSDFLELLDDLELRMRQLHESLEPRHFGPSVAGAQKE